MIATITSYISSVSGAAEAQIKPETVLAELGMDSLDHIELVMAVEEEFEVEISNDEADSLKTVADVIALVERKKGGAA